MPSKRTSGEIALMFDENVQNMTSHAPRPTVSDCSMPSLTERDGSEDSVLVRERILELCNIVIQKLAIPFSVPTFDMRLRGVAAGKAHLRRFHLSFNAVLLRENRSHFLLHTVAHEVAHLVAHTVWGSRIKPHGREWKLIMALFGLKGRATHLYDVSGIKSRRKRHLYRCGCTSEILLGPVRHARFRRGVQYICRRCNTPIEYVTASQK